MRLDGIFIAALDEYCVFDVFFILKTAIWLTAYEHALERFLSYQFHFLDMLAIDAITHSFNFSQTVQRKLPNQKSPPQLL